ncbi:unnamed protein product [Albugo candida]|uniref:Uncharacterized protein n=1 Tax=Albugo candida TaxID=65357 RepID=A0A024G910_9STRA|nr:unnamed protein product [Albugo candida]|eukprot:CCI43159.1 unnamed protein product [Albugo candida]
MHYHEFFILSPRTNVIFRRRPYTSIEGTTHDCCTSFSNFCKIWMITFLDTHIAIPIRFLASFDIVLDLVCMQQQMHNFGRSSNGVFLKRPESKLQGCKTGLSCPFTSVIYQPYRPIILILHNQPIREVLSVAMVTSTTKFTEVLNSGG